MDRAIIVERLVKKFEVTEREKGIVKAVSSLISPQKRTVEALKGISFSIKEGELVGFIGPNGAGKTTTLKILSGILYPTDGFVQVAGFTPWERKKRYLKQISLVMGQKNQLWWDLSAIDTFELLKAIYEIPDRTYDRNLGELTKLLDVEDLLKIQVRRLSLGQRMKLELIAALLHQPKVVFLDEPTIGLDVIAQQKMRDFIASYNRKHNATILLTSHNMDDLVNLAKRVIVISEGMIIFDGNLLELISRFANEKIIKILTNDTVDYQKLEKMGRVLKVELPEIVIAVPRQNVQLVAAHILSAFSVDDMTIEEEPVDSVIRKVFGSTHKKKKKIK